MEFSEVFNAYHTFDDFVTVEEAKRIGIIPPALVRNDSGDLNIFPDRCVCGSQNIISRNLKRAMCCNPRCKIKLGYALAELFSRFGVKGIGDKTCLKMIDGVYDKLTYKSHLEVFLMPYSKYPASLYGTVAGDSIYAACINIRQHSMTFAGMISMIGLPELNTSAGDIFRGINSFTQLYNEMKQAGGVARYCSNRGVYDPNKIYWLYTSLADIMIAEKIFPKLRNEGIRKIRICITGMVSINGNRVTKKEFVDFCNKVACYDDGTQLFEIENTSAKESCLYVVADYPSTTSKYLAGAARGVIITADGFITKIKEAVSKCKTAEKKGYATEVVLTMNSF